LAAEDKKMRDEAEARNNAEQLAYTTEKNIKDMGDKIPSADKLNVESKIATLREALKGTDTNAIKSATESLMEDVYKLSEIMYKNSAEAAPDAADTAKDPNVVDAEFVSE
jgi:molecular chaperone DnaK